jgi:hypothetical protein
MAEATLDNPLTLDPRQATRLRVRFSEVDHLNRTVTVFIDHLDTNGNVLHFVRRTLSGPQVETWISNQETTLLNRYMAAANLTGTIA